MSHKLELHDRSRQRGKLRIGNDWNAITIIALSQSNPLKAIAELVENSIDARATNVTIVRGRSEGRHYLEVRDNGQGIPEESLSRIFEPFYTTKEVGKGTGLGLAIAYGIVQEHGGEILAANHPDGGATFTVELPFRPGAERANA